MIQGLFHRDIAEVGLWRVQERTTGSRETHGCDFLQAASAHALVDGVMLAVDGKQRLALPASLAGDQFSGCNQTFFIGKPNRLPRAHSLICGFKSSDTNNRANHEV